MNLMVNPVITDFRQDVNGDIKMLKLGANKEDAWANIAEQGGSAKLDNNKTATINVSTYTEPVVINPTSGKDGMKKATVTLSNIPSPSGGSNKLYAFLSEGETDEGLYLSSPVPPATKANLVCIPMNLGPISTTIANINSWFESKIVDPVDITEYTKVSDTEIIYTGPGYDNGHFYRNSEYDVEINVWG